MDGKDDRKPRFGKPANGKPFVKRGPAGERQGRGPYGKPAGDRKPFERSGSYGKPAGEGKPAERTGPYGKPAGDKKPFERRPYGKPAGEGKPAERTGPYGKPAEDKKPFERRPFGRPSGEGKPVGRTGAYGKPAGDRRPAFRQDRPFAPRTPRPLTPRPAPAQPSLSQDARRTALLVLNRVLIDEGFASLSLDEQFNQSSISPRDKRLATALVYTTLENLMKLDFAIDQFMKDRSEMDPRVINLLRMSACQLLLMDRVPDFAAVNEAVNLTRDMGHEALTGLVNGVLRSLIRERENIPWPVEGDDNYLSVTYSMPEFLVERLVAGYGEEEAAKLIAFRKTAHAITIRRNSLRLNQKEFDALLAKKVWKVEPGLLPDVYYVSGASAIAKDSHFLEGAFSIQGEGSMMAASAVAPAIGARVLDTCAAPGGKTCYLAEEMQNTGRIHAWDLHEHRIKLLEAQLDRLRIYNVRPAVRDASIHQERFNGEMDAVLIDAPCSGTGVMAEKPDVKYRLNAEGLAALTGIQKGLLDTCSQYVKPGGTLVYATCSVLPEENSQQIERFLEEHPDFSMDALPERIPEQFRALAGSYGLQLLPHRDGVEGFFIARMKKA